MRREIKSEAGQEGNREWKRVLVLGIGNRLMEDDGIGVRLVEALGKEYASGPDNAPEYVRPGAGETEIRFVTGETDVDYCLDELDDCDACVIIDASCSGREPCSVDAADLKEVFASLGPALAFHEFDLLHAMKREGCLKEGILITVEASSVGFSAELYPLMQERFGEILREVEQIIRDRIFR